jgi:hypothetical protein
LALSIKWQRSAATASAFQAFTSAGTSNFKNPSKKQNGSCTTARAVFLFIEI